MTSYSPSVRWSNNGSYPSSSRWPWCCYVTSTAARAMPRHWGDFWSLWRAGAWLGSGCRGKSRCVAWDVWRILEICGGISRNWWDFLGNSWDFWGNLEAQRDINTEFIGFLGFHAYILLVLVSQFAWTKQSLPWHEKYSAQTGYAFDLFSAWFKEQSLVFSCCCGDWINDAWVWFCLVWLWAILPSPVLKILLESGTSQGEIDPGLDSLQRHWHRRTPGGLLHRWTLWCFGEVVRSDWIDKGCKQLMLPMTHLSGRTVHQIIILKGGN